MTPKNITFEESSLIFEEIQKAQNILLHLHPNPDGDSVGSSLAMYHALKGIGKNVTVIKGDSPKPEYVSMLPGFGDIVEKNYFKTDLAQFDLFLILDTGSFDRVSRIKQVVFPEHLKTICIDHHASNTGYADINLITPTLPSTTQMLYKLFKAWNIEITPDIAACLFTGIYTDTGGFKFAWNTETFAIAAELVEIAPFIKEVVFKLENNNTPGKLKMLGLLLGSIEVWEKEGVALASASYEDIQKKGIEDRDLEGVDIANMLKSVVGWNIGITLIEKIKGEIKISMRSRDGNLYDVSKIVTKLGGGGHKAAAGVMMKGTIEQAKSAIRPFL